MWSVTTNPKTTKCATKTHVTAYKQWTEEQMAFAVDSVIKGSSIRLAAEEYGVPRSTLGDRISGRVVPGTNSGPSKYLNCEEEEELVHFLLDCASVGYPRGRLEVIAMVQQICRERGNERTVTHGWWESFCRRHTEVTLRVTAPLSLSRAKATDVSVIHKYFDTYQATLKEYDLFEKPCQLFNIDETGLPLSPRPLKMVCRTGSKNPSCIESGNKSQVSIVGCVSAAGYCIPPMVIYSRKSTFLSREVVQGEIAGTAYGFSSKGWMDQDLFGHWFNHFLKYAPPTRPLLVLMDGHSSHYCPSVIHQAAEHQVVLFTLPPNTTHLTQPLDKGVFGPLKLEWRKVCHDFIVENPGKLVTLHCFSSLFAKAWIRSMTMKNIIAAFRTTGIFPMDRTKVLATVHSTISTESAISKQGGLAYLPLLTPIPSPKQNVVLDPDFSDVEIKLFIDRFHKNSDGSDDRYRLWLRMYHPASVQLDSTIALNSSNFLTPSRDKPKYDTITDTVAVAKPCNLFERIFNLPSPPPKLPTVKDKGSSRVLTSVEALKLLDEKENKKAAAQQRKLEKLKEKSSKQSRKKHDKLHTAAAADDKADAIIQTTVDTKLCEEFRKGQTRKCKLTSLHKTAEVGQSMIIEAGCQPQTRSGNMLTKSLVKERDMPFDESTSDCSIAGVQLPTKTLSRNEVRVQKLTSRKKGRTVTFRMPPIAEIRDGEWLSDLHIKAVSDLLKIQFPTLNGLHDPKLGEDLSFPATECPFIQILHAGNHWLTIEGVSSSLAKTYDTMNYSNSSKIQLQIAAILCCGSKSITLQVQSTQKQRGTNDCALFAVAYAVDLSFGNDPENLWYYQHQLRQHLVECLQARKLTPFPSRACRPSKPLKINFPVYCVCRLTEDDDDSMARCEKCLEWFHKSCVNIPDVVFEDTTAYWLCSHCTTDSV